MERLTDEQLKTLSDFDLQQVTHWLEWGTDASETVMALIAELRTLRAENAELRAADPNRLAQQTRQWLDQFKSSSDWG